MKREKNGRISLTLWLVTAGLLCTMTGLFYMRAHITEIGRGAGNGLGKTAGAAIGSARGVMVGIEQGKNAGREEGLSAKDTTADLSETMESVGKLEVLAAGVKLQNFHEVGDNYKVLYLAKGDALFTVDVGQADIQYSADGNELCIKIPQPVMELYIDEEATEKLAETQNFSLTAPGAKEGITAYLHSMAAITEQAEKNIANYGDLMDAAREAAIRCVEQLAATACGASQKIVVEFQ